MRDTASLWTEVDLAAVVGYQRPTTGETALKFQGKPEEGKCLQYKSRANKGAVRRRGSGGGTQRLREEIIESAVALPIVGEHIDDFEELKYVTDMLERSAGDQKYLSGFGLCDERPAPAFDNVETDSAAGLQVGGHVARQATNSLGNKTLLAGGAAKDSEESICLAHVPSTQDHRFD